MGLLGVFNKAVLVCNSFDLYQESIIDSCLYGINSSFSATLIRTQVVHIRGGWMRVRVGQTEYQNSYRIHYECQTTLMQITLAT